MSYFSSDLVRGKLLLLYFLDQAKLIWTEYQLFRACSENDWLDYFSFFTILGDLHENRLIDRVQTKKGHCIELNEEGKKTLEAFEVRLPESIRSEIDDYIRKNKKRFLIEAQYKADYRQADGEVYLVTMQILELDEPIYTCSINVHTKVAAQTLCHRWSERADQIYREMLAILTAE